MTSANISIVRWNSNFDQLTENDNSRLFIADPLRHVIKCFNSSDPNHNFLQKIAGLPYNPGHREGPASTSLLNSPFSVISGIFKPEDTLWRNELENSKEAIVFADKNCYDTFLQNNKTRGECEIKDGTIFNMSLLRLVYNQTQVDEVVANMTVYRFADRILLVSDTNNHCLKLIDLKEKLVKTIAGKCGEAGFQDGYMLNSRLNCPRSLGIDRKNRIYVDDSGNGSIRRLILPEEYLEMDQFLEEAQLWTLINGTCFSLPENYQFVKKRQLGFSVGFWEV